MFRCAECGSLEITTYHEATIALHQGIDNGGPIEVAVYDSYPTNLECQDCGADADEPEGWADDE